MARDRLEDWNVLREHRVQIDFEQNRCNCEAVRLSPFRMQLANDADFDAAQKNTCRATRMERWMIRRLKTQLARREQGFDIALHVIEICGSVFAAPLQI